MSKYIDFIIGKKVLIFDTETSGIPIKKPNKIWGSRDEYHDYFNNEAYDTSRIISIAWYYTDNFQQHNIDLNSVQYYIIKPDNNLKEINNSYIHGITYNMAIEQGLDFEIILTKDLEKNLLETDYIIAHNVMFDIHILLNQLHRIHKQNIISHINNLLDNKQCICSGEIGKPICKLEFPNTKYPKKIKTNYKMPKLAEFYKIILNKEIENAHNAKGDVQSLLEILTKI